MRLKILDSGHSFGTKVLFALIRTASRQAILDVIKLVKYRPDFYGTPMSRVTQEAMRGPSAWSVGDRELMAAFVAKINRCEFCTKAHTAVADLAYGSGRKTSAVLCDLESAGIDQPLRATLLMLSKLTREHGIDADDMRAVIAAGASFQQIEDALAVSFSFNIIGRLANAFGFSVPPPRAFEAGAKYLLARGYR
jgi:AhpD family alkylhydroperoxidase